MDIGKLVHKQHKVFAFLRRDKSNDFFWEYVEKIKPDSSALRKRIDG